MIWKINLGFSMKNMAVIILKRSKLLTDHTHANKENDHHHIDYDVPPFNDERQKEYAGFIAWECILHGIKVDASNNYYHWR